MDFLSKKAKQLTPYIAGLQPQEDGWVKLNTNENPYPPTPGVYEALGRMDIAKLRLYPDGDSRALKEAIAANLRLNAENIFCGNGSDEVLALAFQAFFSGKCNVQTPDISYGFYPVWGKMYDVGLNFLPLGDDFSINPKDYKGANGVIIANPNAPTSLALRLCDIEQIVTQNPNGVVLIDEAYIDFADVESAVNLVKGGKYKNLLVVRTFSKSHALAGMRVGYAIGNPGLIDALCRVRDTFNSYPLDMLAQTAAIAAIEGLMYLEASTKGIVATRDKTAHSLRNMGYTVLPSQTNFLFITNTPVAGSLYQYLLENKILARYWDTPKLKECLRVSIGTDSDMEVFLSCVQEFTSARLRKQK